MEGRHSRWSSQPRPRDLLRKIREFALAMIEDLSIGRSPEIFIDRFRNYCTNPDSNWVLLIIQQLLQENRHGSKAWFGTEVILKKFFLKHNNTKPALRGISITCILLYFQVSVGKGLVMGWLRFLEAGNVFDCINRPNTAFPVPIHVEEVKDIVSVARYILVVEKESGAWLS
ncbi:meiotic recombination protein SPO11-1-like isoform X5 [Malus sylvestris]|uniref:meiotic recombination protein SPO11-1-like isoform X5 n=1 Tax=Malus sylvestris TaxID=3752 RepID=UPI0021AD0DD1|nr:meiotic recombination protein SPO11-1-like isoform X5 [Malus sylvestris]